MGIEKLYESNNYLVVNKPYDMYINSDDENEKNTVTNHVASPDSHLSTSINPLHFIQRLDYSTSGVLCIAKNKTAAARAGKLFEKRLTGKYYLAVVRGHMDEELCDIHYEVGVDPLTVTSSHRMLAVTSPLAAAERPRAAHTRLLPLQTGLYCGDRVTVVLLKLNTGRRHQLRVHCSALGHTILGDYTYSNTLDCTPHRMYLHATRLVLPVPHEPLDIKTPDPFFTDQQFVKNWKPLKEYNKYRSSEDFLSVCDIVDKPYVVGVKYKVFSCSQSPSHI